MTTTITNSCLHFSTMLNVPIIVFDSNGKRVFFSPQIEQELGHLPQTFADLITLLAQKPESRMKLLEEFESLSQPGDHLNLNAGNINCTTQDCPFDIHAVLIKEHNETLIVVKARNIANEKRVFAKLETLERQASVGQVAAGITHEFNNILTAMLGWTQIAAKSAKDNESASAALATIENNTRRAKQIASELLQLAKPARPTEESTDILSVLSDALGLLSWELNAAQISVTQNITVAENRAICKGHSTRLMQVFINIIRNAIEATPSKGTLMVTVTEANNTVNIAFKDSGHGIPPSVVPKIFDHFFSTKTKSNGTGGSGLGLSICKKIIEEHHGSLTFETKRPGGTTFTVSLPISNKIITKETTEDKSRSSFPPGVSVLVIDDEPDICEMIRTALTLRGANVVSTSNGDDAVKMASKELFHAAFVDFSMSGLSGHELGHALADVQPEMPVVFMSGVNVPFNDNANMTDFLKKPFDLHEIQRKLREVLDRSK